MADDEAIAALIEAGVTALRANGVDFGYVDGAGDWCPDPDGMHQTAVDTIASTLWWLAEQQGTDGSITAVGLRGIADEVIRRYSIPAATDGP
jgi:hypothetical protein